MPRFADALIPEVIDRVSEYTSHTPGALSIFPREVDLRDRAAGGAGRAATPGEDGAVAAHAPCRRGALRGRAPPGSPRLRLGVHVARPGRAVDRPARCAGG